jgi:hypothetical protein
METLLLDTDPETGRFFYQFRSKDFPTQVFAALTFILFMSDITQGDFLHCANCDTGFVPMRKPRKGTPNYCSRKCANVVMAREYRARKKKRSASKKAEAKKKRGTKRPK